jgi:hypothetical protein
LISTRHFLILSLFALPFLSKGQSLSFKADSITIFYLLDLTEIQDAKFLTRFDTLMNHRREINLTDSIDNSTADYLIIDESICYYTNTFTTSIYSDADDSETESQFRHLHKEVKRSKGISQLNYAKWEKSEHDKKCRKKSNLKEEAQSQIESTYRILTLINIKTREITVSVQYPPKKAKCHFIYVGGGKC